MIQRSNKNRENSFSILNRRLLKQFRSDIVNEPSEGGKKGEFASFPLSMSPTGKTSAYFLLSTFPQAHPRLSCWLATRSNLALVYSCGSMEELPCRDYSQERHDSTLFPRSNGHASEQNKSPVASGSATSAQLSRT